MEVSAPKCISDRYKNTKISQCLFVAKRNSSFFSPDEPFWYVEYFTMSVEHVKTNMKLFQLKASSLNPSTYAKATFFLKVRHNDQEIAVSTFCAEWSSSPLPYNTWVYIFLTSGSCHQHTCCCSQTHSFKKVQDQSSANENAGERDAFKIFENCSFLLGSLHLQHSTLLQYIAEFRKEFKNESQCCLQLGMEDLLLSFFSNPDSLLLLSACHTTVLAFFCICLPQLLLHRCNAHADACKIAALKQ